MTARRWRIGATWQCATCAATIMYTTRGGRARTRQWIHLERPEDGHPARPMVAAR
jgi:hypothetical protein